MQVVPVCRRCARRGGKPQDTYDTVEVERAGWVWVLVFDGAGVPAAWHLRCPPCKAKA